MLETLLTTDQSIDRVLRGAPSGGRDSMSQQCADDEPDLSQERIGQHGAVQCVGAGCAREKTTNQRYCAGGFTDSVIHGMYPWILWTIFYKLFESLFVFTCSFLGQIQSWRKFCYDSVW